MAAAVVRNELNRGVLSAKTRRRGLQLVLTVAILYRAFLLWRALVTPGAIGESTADPGLLGPFLGQDQILLEFLQEGWWVGSPVYSLLSAAERNLSVVGIGLLGLQALLGVVSAGLLYRMSLPWMGFPTAVLSGLFFTVSTSSAAGGIVLLPEFLLAWGGILLLTNLTELSRWREPSRGLRSGLALGGISLLGGMGALWFPFALLWLPWSTRALRGGKFLQLGWRLALGWVLVLAPGIVQGVVVHDGFTPPFANALGDLAQGLRNPEPTRVWNDAHLVDPAARYEARRKGLATRGRSELEDLGAAWQEAENPLRLSVRRARAFLGGNPSGAAYLDTETQDALSITALPTLPIAALAALAWLGGFALLGSLRSFAPLYFGVGTPLLVAVAGGLGPEHWMVAMPFLCLLAGYGCARIWSGRTSPGTWILVPLVLASWYLLTRVS